MVTLTPGRGAQVTLTGLAQQAARGSYTTTLKGNAAEKIALELAGTAPDGSTVNGTTLTGAAPVDPVYGNADSMNFGVVTATGLTTLTTVAFSAADTITAKASGVHADATALTATVNNVTKVATAKDSVVLPVMNAGQVVFISNSGTASAQIFAAGTATIDGVATDTGIALDNAKKGIFFAVTPSKIFSVIV